MPRIFCLPRTALWLIACALGAGSAGLVLPAQAKAHAQAYPARHAPAHKTAPGAAGRRHVGKASFYLFADCRAAAARVRPAASAGRRRTVTRQARCRAARTALVATVAESRAACC